MSWRGRKVRAEEIRDTALLVIEGDHDGSCPPGQGRAALRLCTGFNAVMKRYDLQHGAGHETLFEGTVWEAQIYPLVRDLIRDRV
jgi:poly(3-hydroxybutyrate) depolymerase